MSRATIRLTGRERGTHRNRVFDVSTFADEARKKPLAGSDIIISRHASFNDPYCSVEISKVVLDNANGELNHLQEYYFNGGQAVIQIDSSAGLYQYEATISSLTWGPRQIHVGLTGKSERLNRELHEVTVDDLVSGNPDNGAEIAPCVLGKPHNITPLQTKDDDDDYYLLHNAGSEIDSVSAYDGGMTYADAAWTAGTTSYSINAKKLYSSGSLLSALPPSIGTGWSWSSPSWSCTGAATSEVDGWFNSHTDGNKYRLRVNVSSVFAGNVRLKVGGKGADKDVGKSTPARSVAGEDVVEIEPDGANPNDLQIVGAGFTGSLDFDMYRMPSYHFGLTPENEGTNTVGLALYRLARQAFEAQEIKTMKGGVFDYAYGDYITQRQNLIEVMNRVLPALWFHGVGRDNRYGAGTIGDVSKKAVKYVLRDYHLGGPPAIQEFEIPAKSVRIKYLKNFTPLTESQIHKRGVSSHKRWWWKNEYALSKWAFNTTPKAPNAVALEHETNLTNATDAGNEGNRILDFMMVPRTLTTLPLVNLEGFEADIGDAIEIDFGALYDGQMNGRYFLLGYDHAPQSNKATLELLR